MKRLLALIFAISGFGFAQDSITILYTKGLIPDNSLCQETTSQAKESCLLGSMIASLSKDYKLTTMSIMSDGEAQDEEVQAVIDKEDTDVYFVFRPGFFSGGEDLSLEPESLGFRLMKAEEDIPIIRCGKKCACEEKEPTCIVYDLLNYEPYPFSDYDLRSR